MEQDNTPGSAKRPLSVVDEPTQPVDAKMLAAEALSLSDVIRAETDLDYSLALVIGTVLPLQQNRFRFDVAHGLLCMRQAVGELLIVETEGKEPEKMVLVATQLRTLINAASDFLFLFSWVRNKLGMRLEDLETSSLYRDWTAALNNCTKKKHDKCTHMKHNVFAERELLVKAMLMLDPNTRAVLEGKSVSQTSELPAKKPRTE